MDKKTSAKRFDAAEFFNKILGSRFLLTIFSIVISFVVGAAFMLIIGINPLVAYEKLITGALGKPKFISYCVVYANAADLYRPCGRVLVQNRCVQYRRGRSVRRRQHGGVRGWHSGARAVGIC